jgi:hypothetical protein
MVSFSSVYQRVIVRRRVIVFLSIFAYAAFRVVHPDEDGSFFDLFFIALLVMLIARWPLPDAHLAHAIALDEPGTKGCAG